MSKIKKILCPIDLSIDNAFVVEYATDLAHSCGAKISCVYVESDTNHIGFHIPSGAISDFVGEDEDDTAKTLKKFVRKNFPNGDVDCTVLIGYPAEEILGFAEKEAIDLIVIATQSKKGLNRLLFGSVTEKVVRGAVCPVLTVHPDEY